MPATETQGPRDYIKESSNTANGYDYDHPNGFDPSENSELRADLDKPAIPASNLQSKKKLVYLCVQGRKNYLHYAVVPLPASYQQAKEVAIDVLGGYLGYPNVTPNDIYLRYGIKRGANTNWAYIKPAFWDQVISGGEDLRIVRKQSGGQDEVQEEQDKHQLVTFRLGTTAKATFADHYVRIIVGDSYKETKQQAFEQFKRWLKPDASPDKLTLRAVIKDQQGEWVLAVIPILDAGWKTYISEMKKEHPKFEILVEQIK